MQRRNLNGNAINKSFSINQRSETPKNWYEQLQLIPVLFLKGDKAFDTYALIDPGSQFSFVLDAIAEYQFTRLIFGANCLPSCAIYVLNHCAKENIQQFPEALEAVRKHFYMDDYIQSHAAEKDACKAVLETKHCLKTGGFRLTKFVSNSSIVLNQIPLEDKDNQTDIVRVLGVKWDFER